MSCYDLSKNFQDDVNNLMMIIQEIIEAYEQNKYIDIYMKELSECYQKVKETQLQQKEFDDTIKEVLGLWQKNQ